MINPLLNFTFGGMFMAVRYAFACKLFLVGILSLTFCSAYAQTVVDDADDPVLRDKMDHQMALDLAQADPEATITCFVILENTAASSLKDQMPVPRRIELYRRLAFDMQERLLDEIGRDGPGAQDGISLLEQHWLLNAMVVEGKPRDIRRLVRNKKVRKVSRGGRIRLLDPFSSSSTVVDQGTSWNVAMVGADGGWDSGFDGDGVVIGHLDTGADFTHPALAGKWAGYWYDAVNGRSEPYDDHGHGTHTLGTLVGGDGLGAWPYDIGVAPGARWVGAKVLDDKGRGTYRQCLRGLQYIVELKTEGVDVRIICGSWTLDDMGRDVLIDVCNTLLDLDVLPVFAVGNDGPGPGSVDVPGCYPSVLAVGALDEENHTPDFSSRGPAPRINADSVAPLVPNNRFFKPDLAAPGVHISSAAPGGGYALMSGSSMAAPHVAGAAALLLQKNPSLDPRELAAALLGSARPPLSVAVLPNNDMGWGMLDIRAALAAVSNSSVTAAPESDTFAPALSVRVGRGAGAIVSYALQRGASGRIEIYDLAGRLVRRLEVTGDGSPRETYWDGADVRGRRVTSGVYVVRLSGAGVDASRSFALIR